MQKMPLETRVVTMKHESGSKYYQALSIWHGDSSVGVHLRKWGAVGTIGQYKLSEAIKYFTLAADMEDIVSKKRRRGYSIDKDYSYRSDVSGLRNLLTEFNFNLAEIQYILLKLELSGEPDEAVVIEETEIDRGVEWASW